MSGGSANIFYSAAYRHLYFYKRSNVSTDRSELPPEKPHGDPSAIAARVRAIWRCAPPVDINVTLAGVCRRMSKDDKPVVRYQTLVAKWPKVKEILDAVPRIRFCDPSSEDMAEVLRNLENVERDAIARIDTYARSLIELFGAGIDMRHKRTIMVHMKPVCVGSSYCFSGSASVRFDAIDDKLELPTLGSCALR
ncbi:hypothetical protein PRIC1_004780 [Phytophthora ramorum]